MIWAYYRGMSMKFNEESSKPPFIYKRNPLVEHAWQIFALKEGKADYEPVGEYTVLDLDEPSDLTEKKMANLIAILNGRRELQQLGELTKSRLLFTQVPEEEGAINKKLIFRTYDGDGISKENAILVIEKGVFKDGGQT